MGRRGDRGKRGAVEVRIRWVVGRLSRSLTIPLSPCLPGSASPHLPSPRLPISFSFILHPCSGITRHLNISASLDHFDVD